MRKTWSIDTNHWESLPEEFLNGNWKKANYVSSDSKRVSTKGGIYMYCVSIPKSNNNLLDNIRTPIYMGISDNLRRRFNQHLKKKEILEMASCFSSKLSFMFLVIHPYDEKNIKIKFEQPMIDCFGKVVNRINSVVKREENEIPLHISEFKPI